MNKLKELNFYVPIKGWLWVAFWLSWIGVGFTGSFLFVPCAMAVALIMWLSLAIF